MPNGGVKKESFQAMDTASKLDVLFDQQSEIINYVKRFKHGLPCETRDEECEKRFKGLERNQYKFMGGLALLMLLVPLTITLLQVYG